MVEKDLFEYSTSEIIEEVNRRISLHPKFVGNIHLFLGMENKNPVLYSENMKTGERIIEVRFTGRNRLFSDEVGFEKTMAVFGSKSSNFVWYDVDKEGYIR